MSRSSMASFGFGAALALLGCSDEPIGAPIDDEWSTFTDAGKPSRNERDGAAANRDAGASHEQPPATDSDATAPLDASAAETETDDGGPTQAVDRGSLGPKGGTLTTEDGSALLVVPEAALSAATELTLRRVIPAPNGALLAVELGPVSAQFARPFTLTVSYAEFDLSSDPARLVMARLDSNGWTQFPDAVLSPQARTLSLATVDPATYGVLVGPEIEVVPEPEVDAGAPPCPSSCNAIDASSSDTSTGPLDASSGP